MDSRTAKAISSGIAGASGGVAFGSPIGPIGMIVLGIIGGVATGVVAYREEVPKKQHSRHSRSRKATM